MSSSAQPAVSHTLIFHPHSPADLPEIEDGLSARGFARSELLPGVWLLALRGADREAADDAARRLDELAVAYLFAEVVTLSAAGEGWQQLRSAGAGRSERDARWYLVVHEAARGGAGLSHFLSINAIPHRVLLPFVLLVRGDGSGERFRRRLDDILASLGGRHLLVEISSIRTSHPAWLPIH